MADTLYERNSDLEENFDGLPKNPFFNTQIMRYFREKMAPYAPLLTKVPFYLTDTAIALDNTNTCEYWFKVFKTDILQGQRHQKLSRVVRALSENVEGKNNLF